MVQVEGSGRRIWQERPKTSAPQQPLHEWGPVDVPMQCWALEVLSAEDGVIRTVCSECSHLLHPSGWNPPASSFMACCPCARMPGPGRRGLLCSARHSIPSDRNHPACLRELSVKAPLNGHSLQQLMRGHRLPFCRWGNQGAER